MIIKIHIGREEGQLYSFNPEGSHLSLAFQDEYLPNDAGDYSGNRDYAQSVWIELSQFGLNPTNFASYESALAALESQVLPEDIQDILLVNASNYQENQDGNNTFLVSPLDGFLHFKIRKSYLLGLNPNPSIKIISPALPPTLDAKFCIEDVQCSSSNLNEMGVNR